MANQLTLQATRWVLLEGVHFGLPRNFIKLLEHRRQTVTKMRGENRGEIQPFQPFQPPVQPPGSLFSGENGRCHVTSFCGLCGNTKTLGRSIVQALFYRPYGLDFTGFTGSTGSIADSRLKALAEGEAQRQAWGEWREFQARLQDNEL